MNESRAWRTEATSHPVHRGGFRLAELADLCKRHEASLSYLCISCIVPPRALHPQFVLPFCIACRDGNVRSHSLAQVGPFLQALVVLSLIHISEPTRQAEISYAVFCLKK